MGNAGCDGWLRNVVSFGPRFCTLVPVGRKSRRMGWQTSRAHPRQVPPELMCLPLMGHTGKRDKEDGFAQSQVRVLEDCLWMGSCRDLEVRARSFEPHLLWQGFTPEHCLKMSFLKHRKLVIFSQCLWSDYIVNLHVALGIFVFLNTNILWLQLLMHRLLFRTAPCLPWVFPTGFLIQIIPGSGLAFSFLFSSVAFSCILF